MINIFENHKFLDKKFLFKLVFACYFLVGMHLYLPHVGGGGLYVPYNIFGWLTIGILIGISFWYISEYKKLEFSRFQIFGWVMFLLLLVPMYYPNNEFAYRATYRLLFLAGGVALYSVFIQMRFEKDDRIHIIFIILIATFIQSVVGLIQYYGLFDASFGLFEKKILPYGTFQQKNVMTTFLATGIGLSLFLISTRPDLFKHKLYLCLLVLAPFTSGIVIIAIKSKAGYIALISTIIFQLFLIDIRKKIIRVWFLSLFLGLFIGWASPKITTFLEPNAVSLYERDIESQMSTIKTRVLYYSTTWQMFMDNKIFGVGYGKFPREIRNYLAKLRASSSDADFRLSEYIDHPHNEILLWVSEGGIVPLAGFLILIFSFVSMISKKNKVDIFLCLSLISPIGFHAIFELPFFISVPHWISILFLIYFFDDAEYSYELRSPQVSLLPMVFFPALIVYNMIGVYKNARLLTNYQALSKYKNINQYEILLDIKNPGPLYLLYNYELMKSMLDLGLKTKNTELLEEVVERSKYFVQHTPIISAFEIRTLALKALGKKVHAVAVEFNARYLYPDPSDGAEWLHTKVSSRGKEKLQVENKKRLRGAESFLEKNKKINPDIVETDSGLQYRIIRGGNGDLPSYNSTVSVHYSGNFVDGSEFDSSIKRGNPSKFMVNQVIKGWTEGLQLMKEGSIYELFIHPKLAYGEGGNRIVPGNSCLIFKVELIKILDKVEE